MNQPIDLVKLAILKLQSGTNVDERSNVAPSLTYKELMGTLIQARDEINRLTSECNDLEDQLEDA